MAVRIGIVTLGLGILMTLAGCMSTGEISGASDAELDRACSALRQAGYDYWQVAYVTFDGRTIEVAAEIHTFHPGPEQTRKYCQGR